MVNYNRPNDFNERMKEFMESKKLEREKARANPRVEIVPEEKSEVIVEEVEEKPAEPKSSKLGWIVLAIILILILFSGYFFFIR